MSGFGGKHKLPNNHGIVCSLCHNEKTVKPQRHRSDKVVKDGQIVEAELYDITCEKCSSGVSKVAFTKFDQADDDDYTGWGSSSTREFLGFVPMPRGGTDATGRRNGKFIYRKGENAPTVELAH